MTKQFIAIYHHINRHFNRSFANHHNHRNLKSRFSNRTMSGVPQLPDLPSITHLTPSIIRILGHNPGKFTLQGTNTYLIGTGPQRILLDTGEGRSEWKKSLQEVLLKEKASISQILLSHWHADHIGGVRDALDLNPKTKVFKSQLYQNPGLEGINIEDITHDQEFHVQGATLRAFHSPGHTKDHMCFRFIEENSLFTGDNVLGHGTAVFEDLAVYLDSLTRMRDLVTGKGFPGHGAVVDDCKAKIVEYIAHRQQREEQIIQVLREKKAEGVEGCTPREIVEVVYKDYPTNLYDAAERGVVQILEKLEGEGRVVHDKKGRYMLTDKSTL